MRNCFIFSMISRYWLECSTATVWKYFITFIILELLTSEWEITTAFPLEIVNKSDKKDSKSFVCWGGREVYESRRSDLINFPLVLSWVLEMFVFAIYYLLWLSLNCEPLRAFCWRIQMVVGWGLMEKTESKRDPNSDRLWYCPPDDTSALAQCSSWWIY